MDDVFQLAAPEDVESVFHLYEQRIDWMNEKNIHQWNNTDYLDVYSVAYYRKQQEEGSLYVLKRGAVVVGAAVLLEADDRWADAPAISAYYIHNLVTSPTHPGAGRQMLHEMVCLARRVGKQALRLDCSVDNDFLNAYYESFGFLMAGRCQDGPYSGNRREKRL